MAHSTWLGHGGHISSNGDRDADENPTSHRKTAQHLRDELRCSQYGSDTVIQSRACHAARKEGKETRKETEQMFLARGRRRKGKETHQEGEVDGEVDC
jgi:hypothetical protein